MFIGHFGVGMAAKKIQPAISLALFFLAAQFLDLLWPTLLLFNVEHVVIDPLAGNVPLVFTDYPISHSLVMALGWSVLFGGIYYLIAKNRIGALLLGGLVLSHWILDLIVHIPDLPLYPGDSPKVGLSLWNSMLLSIIVEGSIFIAGIVLYLHAKKEVAEKVTWRFWSLIAFFVIIYVLNASGSPPPSVAAVAWTGQLQWLFILWAWWADRKKK